MQTLMRDSISILTGIQGLSHSAWFTRQAEGRGLHISTVVQEDHEIDAYVNHGRWIADCPFCKGAECVTENEKVFYCLSCGNEQVGGNFIKVNFPKRVDRYKFEKSLARRPESLRNWIPGETPADIAKENRKNGIAVPEGAE